MTDPKEFSYPGIVERCYEFCAWWLPKISKFPKDQRYILGNRLQNGALDMLEAFVDAALAPHSNTVDFLPRGTLGCTIRVQVKTGWVHSISSGGRKHFLGNQPSCLIDGICIPEESGIILGYG